MTRRPAAGAQATLDQALAETATAGQGLQAPALQEVYRRQPPGYEVQNVAFTARSRSPNPAIQSWSGSLTWDERRRPTDTWYGRDCTPTVTLTAAGRWDVVIIDSRCNRPRA